MWVIGGRVRKKKTAKKTKYVGGWIILRWIFKVLE
jgi:hypothetical protein